MDGHDKITQLKSSLRLPLAELIRPSSLSSYIGQRHLINNTNGAISNFLWMGYLPSMILYGPPGVGKTTLASIMASHTNYVFLELSATDATVGELRELSSAVKDENAKRTRLATPRLRLAVFIDEIHRFSTVQQDFLLPFIEAGDFVFIGATTVDPQKRIRRAILSRCQLFQLEPLTSKDVVEVLRKAALYENIRRKLLGGLKFIKYDEQALQNVADYSNGDTRTAINFIELISSRFNRDEYKITDESDELVFSVSQVESAVKSLTRARLGLRHDENIPLFKQLFNSMNGIITYGETLRHLPPRLVSHSKTDKTFLVSIKIGQACASIPEVHDVKKTRNPSGNGKREVFANKMHQHWAEHMDFSDDSDVEPGDIYTDTEEEPESQYLSRISVPDFRNLSAIHTLLLLLQRGESDLFILKQLILFACMYVPPTAQEVPKLVAAGKAIKKANVNSTRILSDCVERLAGLPKHFEFSVVKHISAIKKYCAQTILTGIERTPGGEVEIVYDDELVNLLLEEPIDDGASSEVCHFNFCVDDDQSVTDEYTLGWQTNSASEILYQSEIGTT